MLTESLSISFSLPTVSSNADDCPPILRQEDYIEVGVTKSDLIKALEASIFGGTLPTIDCGVTSAAEYTSAVIFNSSIVSTGEIEITNGTIGEEIFETDTQTESILFELDTERDTEFPIDTLISYDWEGDTWDEDGTLIIPSPTITVSGSTITVSDSVYGTVIIKYKTTKSSYDISVPARSNSSGTAFDSVAWVIKDCGVELLVLDPPDTAEDDLDNAVDCTGYGSDTDFVPDISTPTRPVADPTNTTNKIDYCSQEPYGSYYD